MGEGVAFTKAVRNPSDGLKCSGLAPDPVVRATTIAVAAALAALLAPFLLHCLARVPRATPIDYNEGWIAYHTARLISGGPLYPPVGGWPVAPVNYPPLSFLVFSAAARWSGMLVLTGRVVSLASLLCMTVLLFRTVVTLTASRWAAGLGALLWLCLLVRQAPPEVGSFNEQMLGHAFSCWALCLYARWQAELSPRRLWLLAGLCCIGLFVKQLLVAVPLALALTLLIRDRRLFLRFGMAGLATALALAMGTRFLGGEHVLANLLAFDRVMDGKQQVAELEALFLQGGAAVLFLPIAGLLRVMGKQATPLLAYFAASLLLGCYAARGVGIDRNAWLDFFFAAALAFGTFAGKALTSGAAWSRPLAAGVLVAGVLPGAVRFPAELAKAVDYAKLDREEDAYLKDVALLRGVAGPTLFEEPLLGFDAGKDFLFDPFSGSQMIMSGRLPETFLTEPIRRQRFAAIVLTSRAVETSRRRLQHTRQRASDGPPRLVGWWTRRTIESIRDHYALYEPARRRYAYFYVPTRQ